MPANKRNLTLSNHAIVSLGILTRSAKKKLGSYNATSVLKDHQQAHELLTQSVLSGDKQLLSLALELNKTLQIAPHLIDALAHYLSSLDGKSDEFVKRSQLALGTFARYLYEIKANSQAYRQTADAFLSSVEADNHTFCLNLIRSFYPYWQQTHQILMANNDKQQDSKEEERSELVNLWNELDKKFLTVEEKYLQTVYTNAIRSLDLQKKEMELRRDLVKLIMIQQRAYKNTKEGYRENVHTMEKNLKGDDLLAYFLSTSREFYPTWVEAQHMQDKPLN